MFYSRRPGRSQLSALTVGLVAATMLGVHGMDYSLPSRAARFTGDPEPSDPLKPQEPTRHDKERLQNAQSRRERRAAKRAAARAEK